MTHLEKFKDNTISLLDCFGGSDGGVSFVKFRIGMEDIAGRADNGDLAAKRLCDMVSNVVNLIKVLNM